jgi:phage-related minor tail protein
MAKLNELLRQGAIDQETYNRAATKLRGEFESAEKFASGVAGHVRSSMTALFESIISGGKNAGQVIEGLGKKLLAMALQESAFGALAKLMPATFGAGGFVPLVGNATGNAFGGGKVIPFARGGVVSGPTLFPMRGATGMMGEAGPEAIMPLTRIGGKLGVAATGGGGPSVVVQVNNNSQAQATASERSGPNGQRIIEVAVSESIGAGRQDAVLRSRFNSRPSAVKR